MRSRIGFRRDGSDLITVLNGDRVPVMRTRHRTSSAKWRNRRRTALLGAVAILIETAAMRLRGYRIGVNVVVRCREGHLFTTIWLPGASLKSLKLGWWRYQRCPVGHHWSLVTPVKGSDLSEEQQRIAHQTKDIRIP
jgi:hypothetical protein